jgi:hypothetical protein
MHPRTVPSEKRSVLERVSEEKLLGKDEMNLAEFPITLLADRKGVNMIVREVRTRDEATGVEIVRKVTVAGSDQEGLPTAPDNLVLLGLLYLTKRANNLRERRVWFTRTELLKVLGWPDSGASYSRIELSLRRWAKVFVLYENSWWDKPKQAYSTKGFGIIDDFELNEGVPRQRLSSLRSNFAWNEVFFQSLEAGFVRTLDLKILLRLRYPTSQQMYRYLGKHFYHSPTLTLDLQAFACEHVGLDRGYKDNGKLKEKLQPALAELESIGFLEPMSRGDRYKKVGPGRWTITLKRQSDLKLEVEESEAATALVGPEPTRHERELTARGVTAATAAELVLGYSAERVQAKLEIFDWLTSRQDKRVSKSPGGYLAEAIRKDYTAPRGFVSKAEQERRLAAQEEQRRKVEQIKRAAEQEQQARYEAEQERITAYWNSLSTAEREKVTAKAMSQPSLGFFVRQYRVAGKSQDLSDRYLKLILDTYILKKLDGTLEPH